MEAETPEIQKRLREQTTCTHCGYSLSWWRGDNKPPVRDHGRYYSLSLIFYYKFSYFPFYFT